MIDFNELVKLQTKKYTIDQIIRIDESIELIQIDPKTEYKACLIINCPVDQKRSLFFDLVAYNNAPIDLTILLDIEGSVKLSLNGALEGKGVIHVSFFYIIKQGGQLRIDGSLIHSHSNSSSRFVAKGILCDNSLSGITIKTTIKKDLVAIDAAQIIKHCIIGQNPKITVTPILEALSHKITCAHASSIGSFDQEALFFLQLRGFDFEQTKLILIRAYFR